MQISIDRPAVSGGLGAAPQPSARPGLSVATETASLSNAPLWQRGVTRAGRAGSEAEQLPVRRQDGGEDGGGDGGFTAATLAAGGIGAAHGSRRLRAAKGRGSVLILSSRPLGILPQRPLHSPATGLAARWRLTGPFPLQVADELVKVQVALNNIAGKRERIKILFKKSEWAAVLGSCRKVAVMHVVSPHPLLGAQLAPLWFWFGTFCLEARK